MTYISRWKLLMLLAYSCTIIPITLFLFGLVFQWLLATGKNVGFFGAEQLDVALKMAVIGIFLGLALWLSYYLPYRKRVK